MCGLNKKPQPRGWMRPGFRIDHAGQMLYLEVAISKMNRSITTSNTKSNNLFLLVIRRSLLCVGASASHLWGVGCAVQSKPTPRLSSKGITGAGHLAWWNDAERG